MAKYTQNGTSCWRKCDVHNADHTHIFYSCNKLNRYWSDVQHFMREILGKDMVLEKHHMILGIRPEGLERNHRYLFWILRMTALKQITKNWKKIEPPRMEKWLESIEEVRNMEKTTHKINNKLSVFHKKWAPYQEHI